MSSIPPPPHLYEQHQSVGVGAKAMPVGRWIPSCRFAIHRARMSKQCPSKVHPDGERPRLTGDHDWSATPTPGMAGFISSTAGQSRFRRWAGGGRSRCRRPNRRRPPAKHWRCINRSWPRGTNPLSATRSGRADGLLWRRLRFQGSRPAPPPGSAWCSARMRPRRPGHPNGRCSWREKGTGITFPWGRAIRLKRRGGRGVSAGNFGGKEWRLSRHGIPGKSRWRSAGARIP